MDNKAFEPDSDLGLYKRGMHFYHKHPRLLKR